MSRKTFAATTAFTMSRWVFQQRGNIVFEKKVHILTSFLRKNVKSSGYARRPLITVVCKDYFEANQLEMNIVRTGYPHGQLQVYDPIYASIIRDRIIKGYRNIIILGSEHARNAVETGPLRGNVNYLINFSYCKEVKMLATILLEEAGFMVTFPSFIAWPKYGIDYIIVMLNESQQPIITVATAWARKAGCRPLKIDDAHLIWTYYNDDFLRYQAKKNVVKDSQKIERRSHPRELRCRKEGEEGLGYKKQIAYQPGSVTYAKMAAEMYRDEGK